MLKDYNTDLKEARIPVRKRLKKTGTIKFNTVETTPVVWKDKLIRFEWVRPGTREIPGGVYREVGCYHFVDMETEKPICEFAEDHSFGCCYTENDKMYVYGVRGGGGGDIIDCFISSDLESWESHIAIELPPDYKMYNNSVCKADGKYIMAIEIGGTNKAVGTRFTCIFAQSTDLINWSVLDTWEYSYSRDRYTACPCIRYTDGYFYMIYLEGAPCHRWIPYIVRSRDLKEFELGLTNPIMWPEDCDKTVIRPERFTKEELDYIHHSINCNNSDFDMCYYNGKTVITYSWGNQYGKEFLALAEYDGTNEEFLKSFFE